MLIEPLTGAGPGGDPLLILLLALAFDAALGDPNWLYRALPHPVALIGRLIEAGDRRLNRPGRSRTQALLAGLALTLSITVLAAAIGWGLSALLASLPGGWLGEVVVVGVLLAFRGLYDAVRAVADGLLAGGLEAGQVAVGEIVGRDSGSLDEAGVSRAAIESLAENFSDGVVAPVLWYAVFGLPGLAAYKAINTLDSMIGRRDPRYADFGKVAARLDDGVNWLPARFAGVILVLAAALLPGAKPVAAWRTMLRDAPKHRSVNAGWQEAALAGALGFALAGPRRYGAVLVEDHWMGDGRRDLSATDIRRALALYLVASALLAALIAGAWGLRALIG